MLNHDIDDERNGRELNKLDWVCTFLAAAAILVAPLTAGTFATPPRLSSLPMTMSEVLGVSLPALLASAAAMLIFYRESKKPVAIGGIAGVVSCWVIAAVWSFASATANPVRYLSVNAISVFIPALLLGMAIARLGRDPKALSFLARAVCISGLIASLPALIEYWGMYQNGIYYYRAFGSFANPDFLAGFLLITIPVSLSIAASESVAKVRFGALLAVLLQAAALGVTGSRAGAGVLAISILIWLAGLAVLGELKRNASKIGLAVAALIVGAVLASAPTRMRVAGNSAAPSGAATASAATAAVVSGGGGDTQGHSAQFRKTTWIGTYRMLQRNPVTGAGIGSFETSYPKYAITAFTLHAHNGFLQWAGETGYIGALALLTGFAAALAFGIRVLLIAARQNRERLLLDPLETRVSAVPLLGAMTALLATLMHNMIDSDFYLVATLFATAAVFGLVLAHSRDVAPLATARPAPLSAAVCLGGVLASVVLIGVGTMELLARNEMSSAGAAIADRRPTDALPHYSTAQSLFPFDPEPHLQAAGILDRSGKRDEGLAELNAAVRLAPSGKTYYRLAQHFLAADGSAPSDYASAITALEQGVLREPTNVQTLRSLGETQMKAGRDNEARSTFSVIADLEKLPYGTVRAMPEVVEIDFGNAHKGLGLIAKRAGNTATAKAEFETAARTYREVLKKKDTSDYAGIKMAPGKIEQWTRWYLEMLPEWITLYPEGSKERADLQAELAQISGSSP